MKEIVISRKRLLVAIIVLAILLFLGAVVMSSLSSARGKAGYSQSISLPTMAEDFYSPEEKLSQPYYGGDQTPTITDTREFLKTSYTGNIKTRNVSKIVNDVKNIIKGADGRVDNFYSSEKNGSVRFVVAKSKFEDLRTQIEKLTYAKLYVETISSQNLLSQQQRIEGQTTNVLNSLDNLQKQKTDLDLRHTQTVASINKEISRVRAEIVDTRSSLVTEKDEKVLALLKAKESFLLSQELTQKQKLTAENNNYSAQSQNLEKLIANQDTNLANVNKQEGQFLDNIETVNGYVSVNWISLWQLAKIYSPISPILIIIVLVIVAWILLRRRGYLPKIIVK